MSRTFRTAVLVALPILTTLALAACRGPASTVTTTASGTPQSTAGVTAVAPTPTPTATPTPTLAAPTPVPTATPTPYGATPTQRPPLQDATPTPAMGPAVTPTPRSITLAPSQDATIWEGEDAVAAGADAHLWVGDGNDGLARRSLLQFDLSSVPAGATITSATLTLAASTPADAASTFSLHRLLASWGEGPSDALGNDQGTAASTGDVTWDWRTFDGERWASGKEGGDFVPTSSADSGSTASVWSGPGLVSDVQGWLDDPSTNFGWIIFGGEGTSNTIHAFWSRNSKGTAAAVPPALTIIYTQ